MVAFQYEWPELCHKTKTLTMLCLSCLCVSHFTLLLSAVQFGTATSFAEGPKLSKSFEPVQSYMLLCNPENNGSTYLESITISVELLDTFAGNALQSGKDEWSYVHFHDQERMLQVLMIGHRGIRSAAGTDDAILNFDAPEDLCPQISVPSQSPMIDATEVRSFLH